MRTLIVPIAVLTLFVSIYGPVLDACGAKFLVATRSARFQRARYTTRPAAILVYQHNQDAGVAEFLAKLQTTLQGVGHKVTLVAGEAALHDAAATNQFNVVMMHLAEARRLRDDLKSWCPHTSILPMKDFVTRAEAARAKEEFGQMLALPTLDTQVFSMVQAAYR